MRRIATAALIVSCLLATGCATPAQAPSDGGMMGGGGSGGDMMFGAVAAPGTTALELRADAGTSEAVKIARVLAPADGWIVVRSATAPGGVLGTRRVRAGENRDVAVELTAADSASVRVALHVDAGARGTFEFDPERPSQSLDKPIYVGESPVEEPLALKGYGVEAVANSVLLMVEDQKVVGRRLRLRYLLIPARSWVSVNLLDGGLAGKRIGLISRPAGESEQLDLPLSAPDVTGDLIVTVFADRGELGRFEYRPMDPLGSVDQPWRSAGVVVSQRIRAK